MNRIKEILTLAPFAALAIATAYMQGYWGTFDILAFPYLSFQELIAYSTAPLFGYIFVALLGMLWAATDEKKESTKKTWISAFRLPFFVVLIAIPVFLNWPEKWLLLPIPLAMAIRFFLKTPLFKEINKSYVMPVYILLTLIVGSYGYGSQQAENLIIWPNAVVKITINSKIETGKLIGKLGKYYFYLNPSHNVIVLPEDSIQKIEYKKQYFINVKYHYFKVIEQQ